MLSKNLTSYVALNIFKQISAMIWTRYYARNVEWSQFRNNERMVSTLWSLVPRRECIFKMKLEISVDFNVRRA